MANPNQDRLRMHFSGLPTTAAAQATGWDTLWESSTFLPWDRGYANPALIDLLANPSSPPTSPDKNPTPGAPPPGPAPAVKLPKAVEGGRRRKALVPGCGKGYDVALFAAYGFDSVGLEVSGHAVIAAKKYLAGEEGGRGKGIEGEYEGKDGGQGKGSAVCIEGDFFDDAWLEEVGVKVEEGFDVIYDNTFLCALPPTLRPAWAARIAQLLAKNGTLICLEFPTHKPAASAGPPWSLPPMVHLELLKRPGEEIEYDEGGVVVASERSESEGALRRVAHYTPKRTHEVAVIKGVVRDCVSVWTHV